MPHFAIRARQGIQNELTAIKLSAPRRFLSNRLRHRTRRGITLFHYMAADRVALLLVFSLAAIFFVIKQREEIALFLVLGSMVPIGFRSRGKRFAHPLIAFPLAGAAQFLKPAARTAGPGPLRRTVTERQQPEFYLNKKSFS